ncbi:UNVERIFIED_CONTAM: hypothetical protein ITH36_24910, partial [Salmonella enterica subsp. enterica serovar Weltevreden]
IKTFKTLKTLTKVKTFKISIMPQLLQNMMQQAMQAPPQNNQNNLVEQFQAFLQFQNQQPNGQFQRPAVLQAEDAMDEFVRVGARNGNQPILPPTLAANNFEPKKNIIGLIENRASFSGM